MTRRISALWRTWRTPLLPVVALALLTAGCKEDKLEVRAENMGQIYGRKELLAAVKQFADSERSPAEFRALVQAVETLRPRFDDSVAAEAERNLLLLALDPLRALYAQPLDTQVEALATTVWPLALDTQPRDGEGAAAYTERLCAGELATECKHIVPEFRPLVLSALVWRQLEERAREALGTCRSCGDMAGIAEAMATYKRCADEMEARALDAEERAQPDAWPRAGKHATPWSDAPVVVFHDDGQALLDGQAIAPGTWTDVLGATRKSAEVLGVHMQPEARVEDLRVFVREAKDAGFAQVALQARTTDYPYPLVEYRLATNPQAGRAQVDVRDQDTIQVLVQALEYLSGAARDTAQGSASAKAAARPPWL